MPLWWRPDGDLARDVPAARRIMPFLMPTRTQATVYFEQRVDLSRARPALAAFRERTGLPATLLHLVLHAFARTIAERPRLNRFVAGRRIWQRRGVWVSFSAKKAKSDDAPIVVLKRELVAGTSFEALVRGLTAEISEGKSDRVSTTDRELSLLLALPGPLLALFVRLQRLLDGWGLLPGVFYRTDPLYASLFVANLGSVGLDAAYHHLFEYGNIPIFLTIGKVDEGEGGRGPSATFRWSFDERIEDGLYCARSLEIFKAHVEGGPGA